MGLKTGIIVSLNKRNKQIIKLKTTIMEIIFTYCGAVINLK
jgi:hypothetical protein